MAKGKGKTGTASNKVAKPSTSTKTRSQTVAKDNKKEKGKQSSETAYERLYRKVAEKRKNDKKLEAVVIESKSKKAKNISSQTEPGCTETNAKFLEDDNFIAMEVTDEQHQEFPSEDERSQHEDLSSSDEDEECEVANNNSNVDSVQPISASRSPRMPSGCQGLVPDIIDSGPGSSENN